jgi:thiamine-phosphate pyrophosphorylase
MPVADARRLLGREAIIGLSIKTREQVESAPLDLLDYVCIGGVFQTSSKDNREPPVRPDGFAKLAAMVRARAPNLPVGAIAGIDESNAGSVIAAGADGIAVISALSITPDPEDAAKRLRAIVDDGLRVRGAA